MQLIKSLEGGLAGAVALTIIHETLRKVNPDAPRMDLLGMNALSKLLHKADANVPPRNTLYGLTMAGDVVSNALYYSLLGVGGKKRSVWKGGLLGLLAGIGAVVLPKPLGLPTSPSNRTPQTKAMTVALYTIGGLVSAATFNAIHHHR